MDTDRAIPLGIGQSSTAMKTTASSAPLATLRAMVASACLRAAALAGTGTRLRVSRQTLPWGTLYKYWFCFRFVFLCYMRVFAGRAVFLQIQAVDGC